MDEKVLLQLSTFIKTLFLTNSDFDIYEIGKQYPSQLFSHATSNKKIDKLLRTTEKSQRGSLSAKYTDNMLP